jgi:hypothetical protein
LETGVSWKFRSALSECLACSFCSSLPPKIKIKQTAPPLNMSYTDEDEPIDVRSFLSFFLSFLLPRIIRHLHYFSI